MTLPNFVVIGAGKSGTTSLFRYLQQHPDVYLPARKELHYFSYSLLKEASNGVGDKDVLNNMIRTKESYGAEYIHSGIKKAIGDISPSYLYWDVQEKIKAELGKIKIIVMLRNPVEKAYSQYMHLFRDQRESLGFYDALLAEGRRRELGWSDIWRYAESSLYVRNLEKYINCFGVANIHVIKFDKFVSNTHDVMNKLFFFLGIDSSVHIDTNKTFNKSGIARSQLVSNFMNNPSLLKSWIKMKCSPSFLMTLRLKIMEVNTSHKPPMDPRAIVYLQRYFYRDIERLDALLDSPTGWHGQMGD